MKKGILRREDIGLCTLYLGDCIEMLSQLGGGAGRGQ